MQNNTAKSIENKMQSLVGANAINDFSDALAQIAPQGSGALLISDEQIFDKFGILVERILRRANYTVQRDLSLVKSQVNKKNLDAFNVLDGVRAVVSVGGGRACDAAKYIATKYDLPLAIVATSYATISFTTPSALVLDDGFIVRTITNSPQIFVADYSIISSQTNNHLASGFGELCSRILSFFEYKFYCLTCGKPVDFSYLERLQDIIDSVLTALEGYTRGVTGVLELVIESGERLCRLCSESENDILFCGADSGFCASLYMLFFSEKRAIKLWGENHFVLSRILVKVYKGILEVDEFFMPPPSNNKRVNALKEYYGVSEVSACKHISATISANDLQLKLYRLNEYKQELFRAISDADGLLEESYKIFKRLYDDDGFSLINYLDSADTQLALALAPDCLEQDTMLALLKNMGITDKYIV